MAEIPSPFKKEFVTYWDRTVVEIQEGLNMSNEPFFCYENHGFYYIAKPDNISYDALVGFQGKKTKVTIEVIE